MYTNLNNSNYNIRKGFLNSSLINTSQFDSKLDEPTYLTFKLNFYSDENDTAWTSYDLLPQALFALPREFESPGSVAEYTGSADRAAEDMTDEQKWMEWIKNWGNTYLPKGVNFKGDRAYSAFEYLLQRNEDFRAYLLLKFIWGMNELQEEYQFYFQEISGLDELFKATPDKGMKISKDANITITCLEGLDQKIKYLQSLYRSVAWDDEYQRWILPDIFRYFQMDIYISEIRTFHQSLFSQMGIAGSASSLLTNGLLNGFKNPLNGKDVPDWFSVNGLIGKGTGGLTSLTKGAINSNIMADAFTLLVMNDLVPVTCIHCSMCEFDVNSNLYNNNYGINNSEMEKSIFKVKVKKAEVIYNWTIIDSVFGNLVTKIERSWGPEAGSGLFALAKGGPLSQEVFNNTYRLSKADTVHQYSGAIGSGYAGAILGSWSGGDATNFSNALGGLVGEGKEFASGLKSGDAKSQTNIFNGLDLAANLYNNATQIATGAQQEKNNKSATERTKEDMYTVVIPGAGGEYRTEQGDFLGYYKHDPSTGSTSDDLEYKGVAKYETKKIWNFSTATQKNGFVEDTKDVIDNTNGDRSFATDLDGGPMTVDMATVNRDYFLNPQNLNWQDNQFHQDGIESYVTEDGEETIGYLVGNLQKRDLLIPINENSNGENNSVIKAFTASNLWLQHSPDYYEDNQLSPFNPLTTAHDLLTEIDTEYKYLSELTQQQLQKAFDAIAWTFIADNTNGDRSWATVDENENAYYISGETVDGAWINRKNLVSFDDNQYHDNVESYLTEDGEETVGYLVGNLKKGMLDGSSLIDNTNGDRSWATDFEGGPMNSEMVSVQGANLNLNLELPDLQTEMDRSWATDFDGGPMDSEMVGVSGENLKLELESPDLQTELDRSWATDFDGGPMDSEMVSVQGANLNLELEAPDLQQELDRSWATDFDGGPMDSEMVSVQGANLNLELEAPNLQTEMDRSWATDFDGGPMDSEMIGVDRPELNLNLELPDLQTEMDRSWATDFDGGPMDSEMIGVHGDELNLNLEAPDLQQELDRSWATDFDGGPMDSEMIGVTGENLELNLEVPNLQTELDRSWATDFDGGPMDSEMIGVQGEDLTFNLEAPDLQTEMDRSWATDFDGGPMNSEMPNIAEQELHMEMSNIELANPSLNLPTSLETEFKNQSTPVTSLTPSVLQGNSQITALTPPDTTGVDMETQLTPPMEIPDTEIQTTLTPSEPVEIKTEKLNSFTLNTNIFSRKNEKLQDVNLQKEMDRSKATDLDGVPEINDSQSLFEKIVEQQSKRSQTIQYVPMVDNYTAPKSNMVILDNGKINPDAKVSDILRQYTVLKNEIIDKNMGIDEESVVPNKSNDYRQNDMIDVKLVDNSKNKNEKIVL